MNYKEIDSKGAAELQSMLGELRTALHRMRMQRGLNQLKDVREIRETRKAIARILTKLRTLKGAEEKLKALKA